MSSLAPATLWRRLLLLVPTLLGVTLLTFALFHLAPGDAASLRAGTGRGVTAEILAEDRALLGLDLPLGRRYLGWLARSATLDFGDSFIDGRPVRTHLLEAAPQTVAVGLLASIIALALALLLGTFTALRDGAPAATALEALLALTYGIPVPAIALLLLRAGVPYGVSSGSDGPASLPSLLAPALCLALPSAITLARHHRSSLLSSLRADFVRTAVAKGASYRRAVVGHALRHALLPMVTLLGTLVPALLSGSVLVERIFGVHGLGLLGYEALLSRDAPTLMALCTLGGAAVVVSLLLADLAALRLDPRLSEGEGR